MAMAHPKEAVTANEAAAITRVPLKQVHRIVDAGLLGDRVRRKAGKRLIEANALVPLFVAYRTADVLTPEARRMLVETAGESNQRQVRIDDLVIVDLASVSAEVKKGLGALERAAAMVTIDPKVMGGASCIRGTRIPVHDIAEMLANGDAPQKVLVAYPRLKPEQLELAQIYAQAYPRRGRPAGKATWRGAEPKASGAAKLSDLPAA